MLISLIGLPGVGKSTVGRRLASRLGLDFVDADTYIENRIGEPIRSFFEREGEDAFRDREEATLAELCGLRDAVVATGGGVVIRERNRRLLRDATRCVYLEASPDDLFRRLRNDAKRPLLQVDDPLARLRHLSDTRGPLYRETAHVTITARKQPRDVLAWEIIRALGLPAGAPATPKDPRS